MKVVILIGYSGHAFVVCDIFKSMNTKIIGYFEKEEKAFNPYSLSFLGKENDIDLLKKISVASFFTAIGDNKIRRKINQQLQKITNKSPINAIHQKASVSVTSQLGNGVMVGDGCIINACSIIGDGVICNTQVVIEHECMIGAYSHIAPGAVLCGSVKVGENTFIGARAVVKEGILIGNNVVIGAGAVIIRNVPDDSKVVGNPQKNI